jgi:selenocysteine-specific translation elongation factor
MTAPQPGQPTFRVDHFVELPGRGAFVVGAVVSGTWNVGMHVGIPDGHVAVTVRGIEFLDGTSSGRSRVALSITELPTQHELERAFPVGTLIEAQWTPRASHS